jgi:hypothetical protein
MPEVNSQAVEVDKQISTAVTIAVTLAAKATDLNLDAAVPIFALPVLHEISDAIIEQIVELIGKQLSVGLQQVGTFIVIDTQIKSEQTGVSQSLAALMLAEKSGDKNAIQAAIEAYSKNFDALAHDDGSVKPS